MATLLSEGVRNDGAWKRGQRESEPHGQGRSSKKARRKARMAGFDLDAHVTVGAGRPEVLERRAAKLPSAAFSSRFLGCVAPPSRAAGTLTRRAFPRNPEKNHPRSVSRIASLERLLRYILRPAIKEARLEIIQPESASPTLRLELKHPWRDGTTHIALTMKRFLDRLAALVPPPNANQLLYGGAFAPRSKLRRDVVAYQRPHVRRRPPASRGTTKRENPTWAELMRHSFGVDVLA